MTVVVCCWLCVVCLLLFVVFCLGVRRVLCFVFICCLRCVVVCLLFTLCCALFFVC